MFRRLFSRRVERVEDQEGSVDGSVSVRVWRRSGGGRVLGEYSVGLSKVFLVERGSQVFYEVEDPPIDDKRLRRLSEALERVREEIDPWLYADYSRRDEAARDLEERLAKLGVKDEVSLYFARRELLGFGPLEPVLRDRRLENVECMGPGKPLTVVHTEVGRVPTNLIFESGELDRVVSRLVFLAGKSLDYRNPKVDNALLPGVGRLTATLGGEISPEGSSFVVRIFPERPWTVVGLLSRGTLSPEIGAYLWLAVEYKLPVLIAGDMGSGKTSYANALLGLIPPDKRIGTAEDVPEFKVPHKNWQRYLTEEKRGIDLLGLVKLLLRANVDYIVVNEIRGEESHAWFQAISTGHGGITTIHADSVESVFNRLDKLGIPPSYLISLALVVFIRRVKVGGRLERRTAEVVDVVDPGNRKYDVLFKYDAASDSYAAGDLWSARTTRRVLELSGWDLEKFKVEYGKRVEFLRRLLEIHKREDINDVDRLFEYMLRFYRGYMPEVPSTSPRRVAKEEVKKAEDARADWILKVSGGAGKKRIVFKAPPGVEVLDAARGEGGVYVLEVDGPVAEVKVRGFGNVEYVVEGEGGRVLGRGVLSLVAQPSGVDVGRGSSTVRARDLARVLDGETRVKKVGGVLDGDTKVKSPGGVAEGVRSDKTLVLDLAGGGGSLCIKTTSGGLVRLVPGRSYGREDFGGDRTVSRSHFRVESRGGKLYIVDVGSTNGTVVNGVRLRAGEGGEVSVGSGVVIGGVVGVVVPC